MRSPYERSIPTRSPSAKAAFTGWAREESKRMIRDFSRYRANGTTPWDYGAPIPSFIDAVHFAHSHHSRILQLADVFLFFSSLGWPGKKDNWMRKSAAKACAELDLFPHRYKEWPSSN
ncbi:DUF3800 domain-containing protein [Caulobacter sp. BE264]|uniref:DUF3800 domain-containing protein n=1 Tax=Caulobacter sp. BE264 TaxID=2817724 RepID=UPI003857DD27